MNFELIAQDVFEYQNKLRQNPLIAIPTLEARLPNFKGNILKMPGCAPLQYKEGAACVQECIDFLKQQPPLPALQYEKGLELSARDHGVDLGTNGTTGHTGTDGSNTAKRISRYGLWKPGPAGQNISYGKVTGEEGSLCDNFLLQLIVDDGKPDRGHRHNVFDPDYKLVGVYVGQHKKFKYITVMDYCKKFTMKKAKKQIETVEEQLEKVELDDEQEQDAQIKEGNTKGEEFNEELQEPQEVQEAPQEPKEGQDFQQEQEEEQEDKEEENQPKKMIKPEGCIKILKKIKYIEKNGEKVKQVTYVFKMKDGSEQKQIV